MAALASHRVTADWGARMLADDHPLYEPLHYNMGAVWPFVTGFVALGHYRYERPWAGYPLVDALSQLTFDFARGRHAELLSGAFYRPLDTAVPHQFFATSMLATPILRGIVGWEANAPKRAARLAPQLPPSWGAFDVKRLGVGGARLDVAFRQVTHTLVATLSATLSNWLRVTTSVSSAIPALVISPAVLHPTMMAAGHAAFSWANRVSALSKLGAPKTSTRLA